MNNKEAIEFYLDNKNLRANMSGLITEHNTEAVYNTQTATYDIVATKRQFTACKSAACATCRAIKQMARELPKLYIGKAAYEGMEKLSLERIGRIGNIGYGSKDIANLMDIEPAEYKEHISILMDGKDLLEVLDLFREDYELSQQETRDLLKVSTYAIRQASKTAPKVADAASVWKDLTVDDFLALLEQGMKMHDIAIKYSSSYMDLLQWREAQLSTGTMKRDEYNIAYNLSLSKRK